MEQTSKRHTRHTRHNRHTREDENAVEMKTACTLAPAILLLLGFASAAAPNDALGAPSPRRLRAVDKLSCGKHDHPNDCALLQDILDEARLQCGHGQEFYTSWHSIAPLEGSVCDLAGVYCEKGRMTSLLVDMLADRHGGEVFLCKSSNTQEAQTPNSKSPFVLPAKSLRGVGKTLIGITLNGITDICDLQDLADIQSLQKLEVFAIGAKLCKSSVNFPVFAEKTSRLIHVHLSNINFKGSAPPSFIAPSLLSFQCSNCSLSGKLPRKLMSSLGCDLTALREATGWDEKSFPECDNVTNTCPRSVCDDFRTIMVTYQVPAATFKLTGNFFEDEIMFEDIVRCSGGKPGEVSFENTMRANQLACDFSGSNVSLPRKPWKVCNKISEDLLIPNLGIIGTLPGWLFDPTCFSWTAIDLSHNHFHGAIPEMILQMDQASYVRLDNNRFSGAIPDFSKMENLGMWSTREDSSAYALTLNQNSFESSTIPFALFTLCNWLPEGTLQPILGCRFVGTGPFDTPSNSFSIPRPDEESCKEGFGEGVKILALRQMNLHTHLRDLLSFVKECYPNVEELYANNPYYEVDSRDMYHQPGINQWIHGSFPDDLVRFLPPHLSKLDLFGTHISGSLPSAKSIAQLDFFTVENTTINGPIPEDWSSPKVMSEKYVNPLSKFCTNRSRSDATFCLGSTADGIIQGWWVPIGMPQVIPQNVFLAYWEQCHASVAPNTQMCEIFPVPFTRIFIISGTHSGIVARSRLPTGKFSPISHPNPHVTKVGRFGEFVSGTLPAEFVAAMSSALPALKSLDFGRLFDSDKVVFKGNIPDNFWSEFPQLKSVNFGNLRVLKSVDSKDGPNKMSHLKELAFTGPYSGEAPLSLIRACGRKDLQCDLHLDYFNWKCNETYTLPDNLKPISDIATLNLTGFYMCENGRSFTKKVRQLSRLKTLILAGNPGIVLQRAAVASLKQLQSLITFSELDQDSISVGFERNITLSGFLSALKGKNMTDIVISALASVNRFSFDDGILSASLLSSFSELRRLDIGYDSAIVDVSDFLSSACTAWKHLQVLRLDGNRLNGYIPECLAGIPSLKELGLGSIYPASISGRVPDQLGRRCASKKSDHIQCRMCPNGHLPWCA